MKDKHTQRIEDIIECQITGKYTMQNTGRITMGLCSYTVEAECKYRRVRNMGIQKEYYCYKWLKPGLLRFDIVENDDTVPA